MKIAFAANHGEFGGGEVMLFAMAEIARELGHDVTIVASSSPRDVVRSGIERGFRTLEIHASSAPEYLWRLRHWDHRRQGLLWCNGLRPAVATAGHPQRIVHLHQLPHGTQRAAARAAAMGARRVIVPSQFMARELGLGSQVLENWSRSVPKETRAPGMAGTHRVGFIGRVSMGKGIGVLAQALSRLNEQQAGAYHLVLAGETRFVDDAERVAVEAALASVAGITTRLGWISPPEFYDQVDLVAVPSIADESFGLVVTEAMSAQVPLVVTDSGAIPDIVGSEYPWMARKGDAADLARVISLAATQPAPGLVRENHRRWQERYSPDAGRERFAALLAELEETSR